MLSVKKHLSLQSLINGFTNNFKDSSDNRRENSVKYTALDTTLSGLTCMFYKSGSMVTYQQHLKKDVIKII